MLPPNVLDDVPAIKTIWPPAPLKFENIEEEYI